MPIKSKTPNINYSDKYWDLAKEGFDIQNRSIRLTGPIEEYDFDDFDFSLSIMEKHSRKRSITIKIHSGGGDLSEALAIIDRIRHSPCHIITIAYGEVCSSAALIFLCGHKRVMGRWAKLMLHQLSSEVSHQNVQGLNRDVKYLNKCQKYMEEYIVEMTGLYQLPWKDLLKNDYWLTAQEAKEFGIIKEIK